MRSSFSPFLGAVLVSAAALVLPEKLSAATTISQWDWNTTVSTNFNTSTTGVGVAAGYGQSAPSTPLSAILVNGTPSDPGTLISGTNWNRSATVNPPLLTAANLSAGVMFAAPTTSAALGEAVRITWSQTVGYRSSRYWQILVSTNGTNGAFFAPSGGTGSSISQVVNGYNSSTNLITGTATVNVSSSGLVDFRTLNGNWLSQSVTTTGTITNPLAAGFVDNINYTLPTGLGFENNANFAFALVGAWDPSLSATNGTNGLVSSFAGTSSVDLVSGYNRSVASGGSMRLDLVTVTSQSVPEPSTYALLGGAAVVMAGLIRRKRQG